MKCKWRKILLGEVVTFKNGKKRPQEEGRIPVYGGNGVMAYTLKSNFTECVSVGRVGAYCGNVFLSKEPCWISDNSIAAIPKCDINIEYLYYLLKNLQLNKMRVGSGQPLLTQKILNLIEITIPNIEYQCKVACILKAIDDKINVNIAINKNLSVLIQTIYQKRFTSKCQGILSDICMYSKERISVDDLTLDAYFSTENMLPNKAGVTTATSLPSTAQTTKCHIGDVLISNIRPYFKKILYCHREGGCSSDVLCFSPSSKKLSAFLYGVLYSDSFFDFMVAGSKGTKMPRGDKQQIMTYPIYVPTNDELDEYNAIAMPILDDIYRNTMENSNLSSLRDTLLPRLISGEVDVSSVKI